MAGRLKTGSCNGSLYIMTAAAALICAAAFGFFGDLTDLAAISMAGFRGLSGVSAAVFIPGICIRNWGLLCILMLVCVHDTDDRIIPNRCIASAFLLGICFLPASGLSRALLSILLTAGLLLLAAGLMHLTKHVPIKHALLKHTPLSGRTSVHGEPFHFLGGGDVKLFLVLGLYLRPGQILYMLLLAGALGLLTAVSSCRRGEKNFPLGPGICAAAAVSLFMISG